MELSTSLVDIASIVSSMSRSSFSKVELEDLAYSILNSGGLIRPLILRRTDIDKFEVINGDFEYYAAVRAGEINSELEMVRAFIVEKSNEEAVQKQVEVLENSSESPKIKKVHENHSSIEKMVELYTKDIVKELIDSFSKEWKQESHEIKEQLNKLKAQIPKSFTPLEAFNLLSTAELISRLRVAGLTGKKAQNVIQLIETERQKAPFTSLTDVVERIKGLSPERMVAIIDSWSRILFKDAT